MADKNFKEDDYLAMSKYEGHPKSKDNADFSTFTFEDQHYFAWHDKKGAVAMRSEGYSSEKSRDNGIESLKKNKGLEERWSVVEKMNHFFLSLKAGNNQEIAKSGSFKTDAEAKSYLGFLLGKGTTASDSAKSSGVKSSGGHSAGYAAALAASGIVAGRIISEKRNVINTSRNVIGETRRDLGEKSRSVISENRNQISEAKNLVNTTKIEREYLPCAGYHGHKVTDKKNNVASFEKGKKHYFAIYDSKGGVRLRGLGYENAGKRDAALTDVLANIGDKKKWGSIKKDNYTMDTLKNADGREIARSCVKGSAMVAPAGAIAALSTLAAEAAPAAVPAAAGLGLWPLLLLLPLIPLFLLCTPTPIIPVVPPPPVAVVAPAPVVVAAPVCDCSKLTHPIFKIPSGPPPKATTVLGRAPEYGNSHALDAPGFYNKLKNAYATSAMERKFLDGIFKQMGFENGFKDATADAFSEVEVPRGVRGNLGTKTTHKTVYRTLNTRGKDLLAFKIKAKNACDLHFMKTCGNHFFFGMCDNN